MSIQAVFPTRNAVYSAPGRVERDVAEIVLRQKQALSSFWQTTGVVIDRAAANKVEVGTTPQRVITRPSGAGTLEEKVFGSLVALKVAVSQYAMHLSAPERHRIFDQLDSIINIEDWHEADELPRPQSFQDFLKWMIYSKYFKWTSIGVSDEGNILVAWKTAHVMLTAQFVSPDVVRWTAQINSTTGEVGHTVGKCPLRLFAQQALFYLEHAGQDGGQQNP